MFMKRRRGESRQRERFVTHQGKLQRDDRSELLGVLPFAVISLLILIGVGFDVTAHIASDVRAAREGAEKW